MVEGDERKNEERKEETKFCCQKNCRITVEDPLQQGAASPE
jgi:hypothetical protein